MKQRLTRTVSFDSAHRVMNERFKCYNLHGHRFNAELTFEYEEVGALGYAIDFKEIKRIACGWIDEHFDHASLLNPMDKELIDLCTKNSWKLHIMGLGHGGDVNPSAENIASEIFWIVDSLFHGNTEVRLVNVRLFETPNCWVDVSSASYEGTDKVREELREWRGKMGECTYDSRLCQR